MDWCTLYVVLTLDPDLIDYSWVLIVQDSLLLHCSELPFKTVWNSCHKGILNPNALTEPELGSAEPSV